MWRNIQGWQLFIIILAIIVLVGWKRLPDAARSMGRSMRIFKSEVEQMSDTGDDDKPSAASSDTVDGEPHREEPTTRPTSSVQAPPPPGDPAHDRRGDGDAGDHRP